MVSNEEQQPRDVAVGDVYEVDGLEWKVHRITHARVAACNRLEDGLRHYRTFALSKLRVSRLVSTALSREAAEIPHRHP